MLYSRQLPKLSFSGFSVYGNDYVLHEFGKNNNASFLGQITVAERGGQSE